MLRITFGRSQFWLAPATWIFQNAGQIRSRFHFEQGIVTIDEVQRSTRQRLPGATVDTWNWAFKLHEGEIAFVAGGFRLILRGPPVLCDVQYLRSEQRGLPCFDE